MALTPNFGLVARRRAHGQRPLATKVPRKSGSQAVLAVAVERVVAVTHGPPGSLDGEIKIIKLQILDTCAGK
jgi:hypothetical protein